MDGVEWKKSNKENNQMFLQAKLTHRPVTLTDGRRAADSLLQPRKQASQIRQQYCSEDNVVFHGHVETVRHL